MYTIRIHELTQSLVALAVHSFFFHIFCSDGSSYAVCFDCHKKSYVVRLSDEQFL